MGDKVVRILKRRLSVEDQKKLKLDCHLAPVWIAVIIKNKLIVDNDDATEC